jgi:hypothetical protein
LSSARQKAGSGDRSVEEDAMATLLWALAFLLVIEGCVALVRGLVVSSVTEVPKESGGVSVFA